ncbi:hypothetical protein [Haliangium ochraceum]|uniref:hypothetical protein n=1 Tax=Haliangium ochraceum TaxID=80816 RepID=UPI0005D46A16|nr:hypothetical protein [Haliangium ochraceum]
MSVVVVVGAGCGSQIGDSCDRNIDCSPDGDRFCERSSGSPGGYCTVIGCDYGSCPDDAVCVRFYSGAFPDRACDTVTEDISSDDCAPDEVCTLRGCAPRRSEVRYCMQACSGGGDCRDDYECRNRELMIAHGGDPVPPPEGATSSPPRFCALAVP